MSENTAHGRTDDDSLIYVNGAALDLDIESLESAIDALARDETMQADECRRVTDDGALGPQESETG